MADAVIGSLSLANFTIECAFSIDAATVDMHMMSKSSNLLEYSIKLDVSDTNSLMFSFYQSDSTARFTTIVASLSTMGVTADGAWHWFSLRMDHTGTGLLTCRIDNVEASSTDVSTWSGNWLNDVLSVYCLGSENKDSAKTWGGKLDETAIYLKALTDAERARNFGWWGTGAVVLPDPPTGYIAYYTMNMTDVSGTTLNDVSGTANVHNAILVNSPGVGANGHIDKAIHFYSPDSEHATIVDHNDFHMTNLTISFWSLLEFNTSIACIFQSGSDDTNRAGWNIYSYDDGGIQINIGSNTGSVHGTDHKTLHIGTTVNDSFWHHIAFTYDGATIKAYVDGLLTNSAAYAGGLDYEATNYVRLGCRNKSGTNLDFFKGTVDDLKIYASVKSAEDIAAITAANPPVTADTVAFNPGPNGDYVATHASLPATQTFKVTNLGAWIITGFGETTGVGNGWYRTDDGVVDDVSYEIRVSYNKTGTGTVVLTGMVYGAWQPILGGEAIQLSDESTPTGTTLVITIEIREILDPTNTTGGTIFTFDCTGEEVVYS